MKRALLLIALFCRLAIAQQPKSNFTLDAPLGAHAVGFRVVEQYDYTRSYLRVDVEGNLVPGDRARPMQTLIWYPAQVDKNAKPMLYGRYLDLLATEDNFQLEEQKRPAKVKSVLASDYFSKNYDREKGQITRAFPESRAGAGKFPVVIYAPSFSAPAFENSDLCEYLASYGYIVVATPSMGAHSRGMTENLEGVLAQVADIEFLIGYLQKIPEADTSHVAVAGYSWGGMSEVFAALEDFRISALIGLDGTIRYRPEMVKQWEDMRLLDPNRLTTPFLYLSSKPYTMEELNQLKWTTSYSFMNELRYNDHYFVQSPTMIHAEFSSWFIRFREDQYFKESSPAEVCQSFAWMARYILQFLNAYLTKDAAALQFLKNDPDKNSVPRHLLAIESRQALHPAANIPDFAHELASQGFDKAIEVYEKIKKNDPAFKLEESDVNHWGYRLLDVNPAKAVAVFKLNVFLYPESANVYDSLAEAQEAAGDKPGAIANYNKSLQLNSDNDHAKTRLKELEGEKP